MILIIQLILGWEVWTPSARFFDRHAGEKSDWSRGSGESDDVFVRGHVPIMSSQRRKVASNILKQGELVREVACG